MKISIAALEQRLYQGCRALVILLAVLLTGLITVSVFLRYVLDQSIPAIEESSILIGLWFYFVSVVLVSRERSHLTGGIIDLFAISPRTLRYVQLFNTLVCTVVSAVFLYYSLKYLAFMLKINRTSTNLGWPTAIWVSSVVFGFIAMLLYSLRDLLIKPAADAATRTRCETALTEDGEC